MCHYSWKIFFSRLLTTVTGSMRQWVELKKWINHKRISQTNFVNQNFVNSLEIYDTRARFVHVLNLTRRERADFKWRKTSNQFVCHTKLLYCFWRLERLLYCNYIWIKDNLFKTSPFNFNRRNIMMMSVSTVLLNQWFTTFLTIIGMPLIYRLRYFVWDFLLLLCQYCLFSNFSFLLAAG